MNRCSHLARHCVETGEHHDHLGPFHTLPGACSIEHSLRVRLEHWEESEPTIAVYFGHQAVDLTEGQAERLAVTLRQCAAQLVVVRTLGEA